MHMHSVLQVPGEDLVCFGVMVSWCSLSDRLNIICLLERLTLKL